MSRLGRLTRCGPPGSQALLAAPFVSNRIHGQLPVRIVPAKLQHQRVRGKILQTSTVCSSTAAGGSLPQDPSASNRQPQDIPPDDLAQNAQNDRPVLTTYHYVTFVVIMGGGLLFLAALLYFTAGDIGFYRAVTKAVKRLLKTVGLRQLTSILSAMAFVKYGLEPVIKAVRVATKAQGPWEKSSEYYILKEVSSASQHPYYLYPIFCGPLSHCLVF